MKIIAVAFTLKGQTFNQILPVLTELAGLVGGKSGNTILAHGFMSRGAVIEKGFGTEVVDALAELFPYQMNFWANDVVNRKAMAQALKDADAEVYTIGEIKEGVKEEVDLYREKGIFVSELPLNWNGNMIGRPLTYGQKAVGLTFNHGEGEIFHQVHEAKVICAKAIDQMDLLRSKSESGEYKELSTIAIRKAQSAQMQMVKAITWKD